MVCDGDGLCPDSGWQWYEWIGIVCMVEWGLVHVLAMFLLVVPSFANDIPTTFSRLYDAMPTKYPLLPAMFEAVKAPPMMMRVMIQHSLNLGWIGSIALLVPVLMASPFWHRFTFMFALPTILADVCYWVSLDVPELVGPAGQAQTYIVSIGMFTIGYGIMERWEDIPDFAPEAFERYLMFGLPCLLFGLGVVQKVAWLCGVDAFFLLVPRGQANAAAGKAELH
mmetsp:Transcript_14182/g.23600  ORF Transcript_14182/g.23600 Transcript_14182/m.23600 type:complete len:224 (+) Transcript_14182:66-737(+)